MKDYFDTAIKPLNDDLGVKLGVHHIDVKYIESSETLTNFVVENGWVTRVISYMHDDFENLVSEQDNGPDYDLQYDMERERVYA